jgi:hypothetical protein
MFPRPVFRGFVDLGLVSTASVPSRALLSGMAKETSPWISPYKVEQRRGWLPGAENQGKSERR